MVNWTIVEQRWKKMDKKVHSGMMLTLLLIGMFTLAFGIQPIEAEPSTTVDIIHPQQGQFANYHMRSYAYPSEGWWNTSYIEYVQPHVINTTQTTEQRYVTTTFWCTIDTTNRLVMNTSPDFYYWNRTWYILWIETDVTAGSTINWYDTTALIVGSQTVHVVGCDIDCWVANISHYGGYALPYYDKTSGLMVAYEEFTYGELSGELTLDTTNIPLGDVSTHLLGLIRTIENWNLPKGTENSLKAKLKVAKHMLDMGKAGGAIGKLTAFINRVEMLRERTLTDEQADELIAEAQRITDLIQG